MAVSNWVCNHLFAQIQISNSHDWGWKYLISPWHLLELILSVCWWYSRRIPGSVNMVNTELMALRCKLRSAHWPVSEQLRGLNNYWNKEKENCRRSSSAGVIARNKYYSLSPLSLQTHKINLRETDIHGKKDIRFG